MPYKNLVWVKLMWRDLLHGDDRFIEKLDDSQKGLYLMLLLMAGATENNVLNCENYLKRVLNLSEKPQKIRENLEVIFKLFPRGIKNGKYIKFSNFSRLHNYIGKSQGNPKGDTSDSTRTDKNRLDKIRTEYVKAKGWHDVRLTPNDFSRINGGIKRLLGREDSTDQDVIDAIWWVARQGYCDWTIETVLKKYPDFIKLGKKDKDMQEFEKMYRSLK